MVFCKNFRKDFYEAVQGKRLLVLVALDTDAICACKILQYLFQCDHIFYTIIPVAGHEDIQKAFIENAEGFTSVLMLNCGATVNVIDTLQPEPHTVFYICDSHRPIDVHNIYNQVQVQLLIPQEDIMDFPSYEEVFRDDSDEEMNDEEEEGESDDEQGEGHERRKKRSHRLTEEVILRRQEKRKWEENRQQILFQYSEFASYGTSAALLLYDMAWKMSKDTNDLLWYAIIGVTEQYVNDKVDRDRYMDHVTQLKGHVSRLNHSVMASEDGLASVDCLQLAFEQELRLTLYRHWTLFESLLHSQYIACHFKVWTLKGRKRLHEYLADMGLPLRQCEQKFAAMDSSLRESLKNSLTKFQDKYDLSQQDLFLPSFRAKFGYRNKFCATDMVFACEAVLEATGKGCSSTTNFLNTQDVLTRARPEFLLKAVDKAKLQVKAIVTQVQSFLDMNLIVSAGPFIYAFVPKGAPDVHIFTNADCLTRLARFTLAAYAQMSRNKTKASTLPFILGAPLSEEQGTMLIVGIPPAADTVRRNCFGKAFEQAAKMTKSRIRQDHFNSHVLQLIAEDKSKFFDALISTLQ